MVAPYHWQENPLLFINMLKSYFVKWFGISAYGLGDYYPGFCFFATGSQLGHCGLKPDIKLSMITSLLPPKAVTTRHIISYRQFYYTIWKLLLWFKIFSHSWAVKVHDFNVSTQEAEADGWLWVQDQLWIPGQFPKPHRETLSWKT